VRRTWGALRRPRTLAVLLTAVCLLLAGAPASTGAVHRPLAASPPPSGVAAPTEPLSVGLPSVLPDRPAVAPTATPPRASSGPARPGPVLYLTFDDGPDPHWTPQLLTLLARNHATATFFQIGDQARHHPQTAAAVRAAGQHVANHTAHHARLTELDLAGIRREVLGGPAGTTCLRPPYGLVDQRVRAVAAELGLKIVLWNVETDDWTTPGARAIVHHLLHDVRPGSTVILHDGGGDRSQTLAALRVALPVLAARGYRFEAVPGC
jgi:peptidoglycan-N-acetylglucosamine deacetylase